MEAQRATKILLKTGLLGQFLEARNRLESGGVVPHSKTTLEEDGEQQGDVM
jgi:hypothetical protein